MLSVSCLLNWEGRGGLQGLEDVEADRIESRVSWWSTVNVPLDFANNN